MYIHIVTHVFTILVVILREEVRTGNIVMLSLKLHDNYGLQCFALHILK